MDPKIKEAIEGLQAKFKAHPEIAEAAFTVQTELTSGVACKARIREFAPLVIDEPPGLGGQDSGPNPVELVLAALGTCQEIMYAAFAAVMDIQLDKVEVNVKGYLDLKGLLALDETTPAGFTEIKFDTRIESPEDREKIRVLVNLVEKHCPVLDTLNRPVSVTGKIRHNGDKLKTE